MSKEIRIGDVVSYCGSMYVVVDIVNREDIGSCAYDRDYLLIPEECINSENSVIPKDEIVYSKGGILVAAQGTKMPFTRADGVAPYEVRKTSAYSFRQKQARTITIFE